MHLWVQHLLFYNCLLPDENSSYKMKLILDNEQILLISFILVFEFYGKLGAEIISDM